MIPYRLDLLLEIGGPLRDLLWFVGLRRPFDLSLDSSILVGRSKRFLVAADLSVAPPRPSWWISDRDSCLLRDLSLCLSDLDWHDLLALLIGVLDLCATLISLLDLRSS